MKTQTLFVGIFALILASFSCKKENGNSALHIKMTDAPTVLDEVNVELIKVRIKLEKDTSSWLDMDTKAGIYNLLGLQNGIDTLVANGVYPEGSRVKEIRFILGSNNSVKANGETFPLTIPSGSESGLKIKIDKQLRTSADSLLIDFDAAMSVKKESEGYKLRPVLRVK